MTIDKLIEKYSKPSIFKLAGTNVSIVETGKVKSDLLELKEELMKEPVNIEYNRKVKVPRFVADYITTALRNNRSSGEIMCSFATSSIGKEIDAWFYDKNIDTLFDALVYGYEIEEEPKYYVKVGDKLYFKTWGEDGTCPVFEIDDAPGGVTGITAVDLQEAEMTAGIIGGIIEEANHESNR